MENPNYDVVISGMGSAGLAAAIEAVRAQKRVLIITARDDSFVRFQRVLLLPPACEYLLRMWFMSLPEETSPKRYNFNDDESWKYNSVGQFLRAKNYLNSLTDEEITKVVPNEEDRKLLKAICKHIYTTSSLKDIERFMMRRLQELEAKNGKLVIQYHSQLTDVDLKNGTARYTNSENEKLITFNHLIGADGSNRHALSLVSKNELTTPISLKLQNIGFSKDHAIAYIVIGRADDNDLEIPKKDFLTRVDKKHNYAAVFLIEHHMKNQTVKK